MKVVLVITFITSILVAPSLADHDPKRDSASPPSSGLIGTDAKCAAGEKGNNGFGKSECGSGDQRRCCHPKTEACVGPFTPKGGKNHFVCSTNRALHGPKFFKVVMIPLFACSLCFIFLVHMAMGLKGKVQMPIPYQKIPPLLCVLQCALAFFVVLSEVWKFAVYSAFLSVLVYHATLNYTKLPKWVFALVVALQFFNCVVIIGAATDSSNGVFIPLGVWAADGDGIFKAKKGMVDALKPGADCSAFYDNYYDLESIEISAEGSDPNEKYWGVCTDEWVATVLSFISMKMVLQFIMAGISAKMLADTLVGEVSPYSSNKIAAADASDAQGA